MGEAGARAPGEAGRVSESWRITGSGHGLRLPARRPVVPGRAASRLGSALRAKFTPWWQRAVRGRILPAELRARLALSRGERILAAGLDTGGGHALIATNAALHHRDGTGRWSRLGWELITEVCWDPAGSRLVIYGLAGIAPARTAVRLRDRGVLPELAEERISYTRLGYWPVTLDGRSVQAEARRRPVTGELLWIVDPAGGLDLGDAGVRRRINEAVIQLRDELGISRPPGQPPRITQVPRPR